MSYKNLLTPNNKSFLNLKINTLEFGSGDPFTYETEVISIAFGGAWSPAQNIDVKFSRSGDTVSVVIPRRIFLAGANGSIDSVAIPEKYRPKSEILIPVYLSKRQSVNTLGMLLLSKNGNFEIFYGFFEQFDQGRLIGWFRDMVITYDINSVEDVDPGLGTSGELVADEIQTSVIDELVLDQGVLVDEVLLQDGCTLVNCIRPLLFPSPDGGLIIEKNANTDPQLQNQMLFLDPAGRNSFYMHVSNDPDPANEFGNYAGKGCQLSMGSSTEFGNLFEQISEGIQINGIPDGSGAIMSPTNLAFSQIKPFLLSLKKNTGAGQFFNFNVDKDGLQYKSDMRNFAGNNLLDINTSRIILDSRVSINSQVEPIGFDLLISKIATTTIQQEADSVGGGGSLCDHWQINNGRTEGFLKSINTSGEMLLQSFGATSAMIFSTGGAFGAFGSSDTPNISSPAVEGLRIRDTDSKVEIPEGLETNLIENLTVGDMNITNNDMGDLVLDALNGDIVLEGVIVNGSGITCDEIKEKTLNNGINFLNDINTDIVNERQNGVGVTIEGVLLKDNSVLFSALQTPLEHYEEVSYVTDLQGVWASDILNVVFKLTRIGRQCFMNLDVPATAIATLNALINTVSLLPTEFRPSANSTCYGSITDNTNSNISSILVSPAGGVQWTSDATGSLFSGVGNSGVLAGSWSWTI